MPGSDIRLVAIDIDGTLLDSHGRVSEDDAAALIAARAAGVDVVLVTGRSYPFARAVVADLLPADVALIVSNGAIERTLGGETLASRLLARDAARTVLDRTAAYRRFSAVLFDREARGHVVADTLDWEHPHRRRYWERHQHFIGHATPLEAALTEDPIQVMFNGDVETMRSVYDSLGGVDEVFVCRTEYEARDFALVDVLSPAATKGRALASRAARLGIDPAQVMAIGDNFNDLEMLEFAGVPVVMGNAVDGLRRRGWRETATHDESGVAQVIRQLVLDPPASG